ncbi:MAG: tRNA pseudouridine(55) synthase TruB [Pseudomonadota bacterium]
MARRRKGRPVHGWLILDKPAGMGSTTAVGRIKRVLDAQKAGHAGTLDPAATGLLAIALGEATKTVPYVTDALKAYEFTVRFGVGTNTDDAEGEVIARSDARPTGDAVAQALAPFRGDITQVPPAFSAVKIDGERAYKRARDGDAVELAARPLYVDALDLVDMPDADHARLHMVCGKGGYVRAIARDLGEALGMPAHVTALRRVWSGPFSLDDAVTEADLDDPDTVAAALLPLEAALADLPRVTVNDIGAGRLRNGNEAPVVTSEAELGDLALATHRGTPVALGTYRAGMVFPERVFNL